MLLIDVNPVKFKGDKCCYLAAFVACSLALLIAYSCSLVNGFLFSFWFKEPDKLFFLPSGLTHFLYFMYRCEAPCGFNGIFWQWGEWHSEMSLSNLNYRGTGSIKRVVSTKGFSSMLSDLPNKKVPTGNPYRIFFTY